MLLTIDIGNSHIVCGLFDGDKLVGQEIRFETDKNQTERYYTTILKEHILQSSVSDVIISSVVPELDDVFTNSINTEVQIAPLFVSTRLKTNVTNLSETETQLGADRLCDIVAGIDNTPGNKIIIDLGTATKFEVISEDEYLGGAISPGVGDSFSSLLSHASKLPELHLGIPQKVVGGFDTQEHLNSGYVFGFASLIDGMVEKILKEQNWKKVTVFITGGFTDLISPHISHEAVINKTLTLQGMQILWTMNKDKKDKAT